MGTLFYVSTRVDTKTRCCDRYDIFIMIVKIILIDELNMKLFDYRFLY